MSSWTCPYDLNGICQKVVGAVCNPGMRGCILEGQVVFANADKKIPPKPVKATPEQIAKAMGQQKAPASQPRERTSRSDKKTAVTTKSTKTQATHRDTIRHDPVKRDKPARTQARRLPF